MYVYVEYLTATFYDGFVLIWFGVIVSLCTRLVDIVLSKEFFSRVKNLIGKFIKK